MVNEMTKRSIEQFFKNNAQVVPAIMGRDQILQLVKQGKTFSPWWPTSEGLFKTDDMIEFIAKHPQHPQPIEVVEVNFTEGSESLSDFYAQFLNCIGRSAYPAWIELLQENETEFVTIPVSNTLGSNHPAAGRVFVVKTLDLLNEFCYRHENSPESRRFV